MKKQELKKLLDRYGVSPSKIFGQNYLIDDAVLHSIVESSELTLEDRVIEIGAGLGNLTQELAKRAGEIIAFETDPRAMRALEDLQERFSHLHVIHQDVTQYPLAPLLERPYKIVSNLPYGITSWVFRKFLTEQARLAVFLVQKEVAERACAKPGDMSLLSVAVQLYGNPKIIKIVPPHAFYPQPKVTSAILRVVRDHPLRDDPFSEELMGLAKMGFASKRKKLLNNLVFGLKKEKKSLQNAFEKIGISLNIRAEELSLQEWRKLVDVLHTEMV